MRIRIRWDGGEVRGYLFDTPTSRLVFDELPMTTCANTWGDEVYFDVPAETELEPGAQQVVEPGTICFWVEGPSVAIPFGPTPISKANECRLASRVNIIGEIEGNPRVLAAVNDGMTLYVEPVEE